MFELHEGIAKITINRPEVYNAFRPQTVMDMLKAFDICRERQDVGVVILTGIGDKAFCSGGDQNVKGVGGYVDENGVPRLNVLDLHKKIRSLPKPVIAMVNGLIGWVGTLVGFEGLTLQLIFGYIFQPLAFILGVSWEEARLAGSFIGQKLVINEFVAYLDFIQYVKAGQLSEHTQIIVTIALCGFANFSSIAILLGGLGVMAPNRRSDIAELGLKALLAATLANLMSAAIAGFFFSLS